MVTLIISLVAMAVSVSALVVTLVTASRILKAQKSTRKVVSFLKSREIDRAKENLLQLVMHHPFYSQFCTPGRYLVSGFIANEYLGRRVYESESLNPLVALVEIGKAAVTRGDLLEADPVYQALRKAMDRSSRS